MPDRLTDDQLVALALARGGTVRSARPIDVPAVAGGIATAPGRRPRHRVDDQGRNKLEADYGDGVLADRLRAGEIAGYEFASLSLRLADPRTGLKCWYRCDYTVWTPGGQMEIHEVKGHMEDDARVKLCWLASKYPQMPVYLCRRINRRWSVERWGARES